LPRPLIVSSTVLVEGGFASREAKIAFRRGDIVSSGAVPETVLDVVRQWGIVNAVGIEGGPLEISNARRAQAEFRTDRGPRLFDAWRLSGPGVLGELIVLDPEVAKTRWVERRDLRPPKPFESARHLEFRAVGHPDHTNLEVSFVGGPPDEVDYPSADVLETDQAVAVIPTARRHATTEHQTSTRQRGPMGRPAIFRQVPVTLGHPLGGRVLVDFDGWACVVRPPGETSLERPRHC